MKGDGVPNHGSLPVEERSSQHSTRQGAGLRALAPRSRPAVRTRAWPKRVVASSDQSREVAQRLSPLATGLQAWSRGQRPPMQGRPWGSPASPHQWL